MQKRREGGRVWQITIPKDRFHIGISGLYAVVSVDEGKHLSKAGVSHTNMDVTKIWDSFVSGCYCKQSGFHWIELIEAYTTMHISLKTVFISFETCFLLELPNAILSAHSQLPVKVAHPSLGGG